MLTANSFRRHALWALGVCMKHASRDCTGMEYRTGLGVDAWMLSPVEQALALAMRGRYLRGSEWLNQELAGIDEFWWT